ncbi:AraC family transcriptional regulator ligand-binding domain-containing protein [Shimia sp. W99]
MAGYIRASVLEGLDHIAAREGQDLVTILARYGLDHSIFEARETEIDFEDACSILEDCARSWKLPDLGIQLARLHSLETLGVISLVTRMERTVRDAAKALLRNQFLHTNGVVTSLREIPQDGLAEVIYAPLSITRPRQAREMSLVMGRNVLRELAGRAPEILSAEVMFAAPLGKDYLSAELGCPVRYGANSYSFLFRNDVLDVKLTKQDVAFHPIIRRYLAEITVERGIPFSETVKLEVFRQLSLGVCSQDKVAAALRMQPRSLQRKLKQEGTNFREIMDEQRRRRSLALVQQTDLPLGEVALAVGYSDQTAFNQAFRRWFGRTPLKVRRREGLSAA